MSAQPLGDGMPAIRYATPTGDPCPRTVRPDGTVAGDADCRGCGAGAGCPLCDPWDDEARLTGE